MDKKPLMKFRRTVLDNPSLSTNEILLIIESKSNHEVLSPKSIPEIINDIAIPYTLNFFSLLKSDWDGDTKTMRDKDVILAQKYLMFALKDNNLFEKPPSLKTIGWYVRNKSHATVLIHNKNFKNELSLYPNMRTNYLNYISSLKEAINKNTTIEITSKKQPNVVKSKLINTKISVLIKIYSIYGKEFFGINESLNDLSKQYDVNFDYNGYNGIIRRLYLDGYLSKVKINGRRAIYGVATKGLKKIKETANIS